MKKIVVLISGRGSNMTAIARTCAAVLAGSLVYRIAIALALSFKLGDFALTPSDLNLITAFLVILALTSPMLKRRLAR